VTTRSTELGCLEWLLQTANLVGLKLSGWQKRERATFKAEAEFSGTPTRSTELGPVERILQTATDLSFTPRSTPARPFTATA